ncbi:hypothetical protein RCL1_004429 [Eukaryota sp. TZLM3-RCL]
MVHQNRSTSIDQNSLNMQETKVTPETMYGQAHSYEPEFDGPITNRRCRDCLFALVFIAFLTGFVYISHTEGVSKVDLEKMTIPMDYYGFMCGKKMDQQNEEYQWHIGTDEEVTLNRDLNNHRYLFFYDPANLRKSVCVQECPTEEALLVPVDYLTTTEPMTYTAYKSKPLNGRCIPTAAATIADKFTENFSVRYIENAIADLSDPDTKWYILGCAGVAILLGFIWLIFLRLCATLIVWITILGLLASVTFGAYYYVTLGLEQVDAAENKEDADADALKAAKTTLYIGYVLSGVAVLLFLFVLWMRKSINLAIDIVQEAARSIAAMPLLIAFPLFVLIAVLGFLIYWVWTFAHVFAAGDMAYDRGLRDWSANKEAPRVYYLFYHGFSVFWVSFFIIGVSLCTIAGAVAKYYFTFDKKNLGSSPILSALWRTVRYNLGSVAFASLIIAVLCFVRWIMLYLSKKAKNNGQKSLASVFKCIACVLKCIEKVMKYINKNAYIIISIYNYSYCGAAKEGFNLIMRNLRRVMAITMVGDSLLFLGKLFIAVATALIATFVFNFENDLHQPQFESWQFMVGLMFFGCLPCWYFVYGCY